MATGASGDLLTDADRHAQSVFKHEILRQYIPRFIAMPGSTSRGNRLVVLDGFAGRGRYLDGTPGSAELILRAVRGLARSRDVATFFVEQDQDHYGPLKSVVEGYVAEGLRAQALPGAVHDHLDVVLAAAAGIPLFLFLDPCGAGLPFERLRTVLAGSRADQRPPTEVLLNFSADLSRRAAGALVKGRPGDRIVARMDAACGGEWWRATAVDALHSAAKNNFEPAAHAVASEYANRLATAGKMVPIEVPVRRRLHHQPIYHLVFLTRSPYGLWEFADAIGRARQAYLRHLGQLEDDEVPGQQAMFGDPDDNDMEWLIEQERDSALRIVTDNLRGLLRQRPSIKLVDYTRELFGDAYGIATEPTATKAARDLQATGELTVVVQAKRLRDRVVAPPNVNARP